CSGGAPWRYSPSMARLFTGLFHELPVSFDVPVQRAVRFLHIARADDLIMDAAEMDPAREAKPLPQGGKPLGLPPRRLPARIEGVGLRRQSQQIRHSAGPFSFEPLNEVIPTLQESHRNIDSTI